MILVWISILLDVHTLLNLVMSVATSVFGLEGPQFEFNKVTFLIDVDFFR